MIKYCYKYLAYVTTTSQSCTKHVTVSYKIQVQGHCSGFSLNCSGFPGIV